MREYRTDLHIHMVLSACAEIEMFPPLIVDGARVPLHNDVERFAARMANVHSSPRLS